MRRYRVRLPNGEILFKTESRKEAVRVLKKVGGHVEEMLEPHEIPKV